MKRYPPRVQPRETPVLEYRGAGRPRYKGPDTRLRRRYVNDQCLNAVVVGGVLGLVLTFSAVPLVTSITSSGAAWLFARLLFPISMLVAGNRPSTSVPDFALLIQYPLYGAVIGFFTTANGRALRIAVGALLSVHFLAFIACLR